MADNKTRATGASVDDYIAARASDTQRRDCQRLLAMLEQATRQAPVMWGPSIVGFGSYRYTYESGRSGEAPLVGFAIRGRELVVYLNADDAAQQDLLARLGKHTMGKACLYFKSLDELDTQVLAQLVANAVTELRRRYG